MKWILASASPRRKELLAKCIPQFEIVPSNAEEDCDVFISPKDLVETLAKRKAEEVANRETSRGKIVLGSDTVVSYDGKILGKPNDEREAEEMLSQLSGKIHQVYTGVCIVYPRLDGTHGVLCDSDCTEVEFNVLSKEFIRAYIATGSPMDKAGAYGIQDGGLVKAIHGSFSNVVGLPLELCERMIGFVREVLNK